MWPGYSSPLAQITPATTVLGIKPAPIMASFSSQGPNSLTPDILKVTLLIKIWQILLVDSYTGSVFFCFRGRCFSLCFEACLVEFGAIAMEIDAHEL